MTEPELITALTNASTDARAVLQALAQYASANNDVTFTLSSGFSYTLPGIEKQRASFAADRAAERLAFAKDFVGIGQSQSIQRDQLKRISGVTTKLSSGLTVAFSYGRAANQISTITVTVQDALGNTLYGPSTRTIQRTSDGYYAGIA